VSLNLAHSVEAVCGLLGIFRICRLVWPKDRARLNKRQEYQLKETFIS